MSYVQPSGTIQLFRGINLDNRYMHTLYFPNVATQTSFFDGLVDNSLSFISQSYSRPNKKSVRVKINAESCQDVSYMRFNNRGNKWYYAFVLAINYINENTTDIVYEIDVMQTWFMGGSSPQDMINPCMVLREHVTNDTFGLNLEPEPIGSDVYDMSPEITNEAITEAFNGFAFVLCTTGEPTETNMIKDGIVNGTTYTSLPAVSGNMSNLKTYMENALGSWDKQEQKEDIVDFFMFPKAFTDYESTTQLTFNINHPRRYSNYTPRNKKLFGYPFAYLYVTTNDGNACIYHWEYFEGDATDGHDIQFELNASAIGGGSIEIHPRSYNGVDNNYDAKLTMTNFPKCSYNYDAYQAFVASGGQTKLNYAGEVVQQRGSLALEKNAVSTLAGTAQGTANLVGNLLTGNVAGAVSGGVGVANTLAQGYINQQSIELDIDEAKHKIGFQFKDAMYQPNIVVGEQVPNIAVGKGYLKYRFFNAHVRDDEMVRLDNFLTTYGYAVNDVKIPNMTGRPYWNFVQTKDCNIKGNMPSSSKQAIAKIMDGGIFFWNYQRGNANIGNFRQSVNSHGQIINGN